MSIRDNIDQINERKAQAAKRSGRSGDDVLLVAVTKLHTVEEINEAIDCGITDIGENKVQEIMNKYDGVKPVKWHLIGHLQTNKVKYIIDSGQFGNGRKQIRHYDRRNRADDRRYCSKLSKHHNQRIDVHCTI